MTLEALLKATARRCAIPYETILKDYAIGHVLSAIASEPSLASTLVMKGGTALKKLYFGDYRFSEDLDFSGIAAPKGAALARALRSAGSRAQDRMSATGPFSVVVERVAHRQDHPSGQEDMVFRVQFPWQRQPLCTVKIEVTADEPVLLPTVVRTILHAYDEELPGEIRSYQLEEIVAEKLRAVLQSEARRLIRSWVRPRCRDYYDLWRILGAHEHTLDLDAVRRILPAKCALRGVSFTSAADFFPSGIVAVVTDAWEGDLGGVVAELPPVKTVFDELRETVANSVFAHL